MACVLVVDGYDESRAALSAELESSGYEVLAVAEEEEAVRALSTARKSSPVDVVILDLPLAEATEAAHALRAKRAGKTLTILAIVSPTDPRAARDAAHAEGVDYFVLRPCPPQAIVKQLRRLGRG
jgi:CheY-like chemotaxis protein